MQERGMKYSDRRLALLKARIDKFPATCTIKYIAKRLGIGVAVVTGLRNGDVSLYREYAKEKGVHGRLRAKQATNIVRDAYYSKCPTCNNMVLRPCILCDVRDARFVDHAEVEDSDEHLGPTPDEIELACQAIQSTWDDVERERRMGLRVDEYEVERVTWMGQV